MLYAIIEETDTHPEYLSFYSNKNLAELSLLEYRKDEDFPDHFQLEAIQINKDVKYLTSNWTKYIITGTLLEGEETINIRNLHTTFFNEELNFSFNENTRPIKNSHMTIGTPRTTITSYYLRLVFSVKNQEQEKSSILGKKFLYNEARKAGLLSPTQPKQP